VLAAVEAIRSDESRLVVWTDDPADPAVAAVHGLVRCAQAEQPGRILLVDGDLPARQTVECLTDEWQLSIRDGEVRAPRLVRPVDRVEPKPWQGPVLITGGTGTLGAHTARHLVRAHGVRDLVLVSRQGPAADGADELRAELTRAGASVRILAVDITDEDAVRALLTEPFAAVVHAAGALADTTLANLDASDLDRTMRPKADAAALLDELTRGTGTALVLYSSAAGVLGNPGQGAYAAANAFLDALARRRADAGDPALSLAWGLWSETSGLTGGVDTDRMARAGVVGIAVEQGLRMFDAALTSGRAVAVPVAIDRTAFGAEPPALWRELIRSRAVAPGRGVLDRIAAADPDRRAGLLIDLVRREAATVLGRTGGIGAKAAFRDLGFDSLTSVELRNRLSVATGLKLPVTVVFDHPTATDLAARLREGLFPQTSAEEPEPPTVDDTALIAEMSAEELIRRALGEVG
jgi:NAD(P)-dependent dehydrogenase (short-subunit alcohol dehydrogenase family)